MLWVKKIFFALTKKERGVLFSSILLAILSLTILVGTSVRAATKVIPAYGGTFSEGVVGQPAHINPILATSNSDKILVRLLFSNLEELSDKIERDKSGKIWRVRLKENIFWSDGERLTSDDVIFTIEKIQDSETGSPLLGSWQGVKARRTSQLEITFELANAYSFFDNNLANLYIIPKHLFNEVPAINWRLSEYNLKPVGSGPFVFLDYSKRDDGFITRYSLQRNDKYFGKKPFIDKFEIQFFGSAEEVVRNFNAGKVDAIGDTDPNNLKAIRRTYNTVQFGLPSYYAIFLNQSEKIALQEREVRMALDSAINKEELISEIFGGKADPLSGPVPPSFGLDLRKPESTSSIEYATSLLENAGWKIGAGGIREKTINSSIIPLEITLTVPRLPFLLETAKNIQQTWNKLGVKTEIREISPAEELDQAIKNRNYDGILVGNSLNSGVDLFSFWHSSERFHPGLNLSLYNNREVDALIESVRQNFNFESRRSELENLQNKISSDYPAIFLYSPRYIYSVSKGLKGVNQEFITDSSNRFLNAEEWYLKTARTFK